MKPSVFKQVQAVEVSGRQLLESPRHWNPGMMRYRDRLWLCYRFHLKKYAGRCATAIVQLDEKTFQPVGKSQHLLLLGPTGTEHHEDGRLFMLGGEPHISYTEMRGYIPGVDYTCLMRYAKLKLVNNRWQVVKTFQPLHGDNDGRHREKNWVFFETADGLHCVYAGSPTHVVIRIDGDRVTDTFDTAAPVWNFGAVRGGTPPVLQPDGTFLTFFHSSLQSEEPPNFVRYYAAAYTFEGRPPFAPLRISTRPLLCGSEDDGHRLDARFLKGSAMTGWKPFCVFPCGMVMDGNDYLLSTGINDWACAVARIKSDGLFLGAANGSDIPPRYFKSENGSLPISYRDGIGRPSFIHWQVPRGRPGMVGIGVIHCPNPMEAMVVADHPGAIEIEYSEYTKLANG